MVKKKHKKQVSGPHGKEGKEDGNWERGRGSEIKGGLFWDGYVCLSTEQFSSVSSLSRVRLFVTL